MFFCAALQAKAAGLTAQWVRRFGMSPGTAAALFSFSVSRFVVGTRERWALDGLQAAARTLRPSPSPSQAGRHSSTASEELRGRVADVAAAASLSFMKFLWLDVAFHSANN